MKSLLYITFSLLVSVAAIYSVARNYIERSDVQLSDLDAPRGTYTYQVDLTTDLGIEKSGVEPMEFSHSEVKGVWRETWAEPIDGVTQVAIYFKSESKLSSNQSAQNESANGKKAFAQVGMDGSLIDFMFAPDVSQKTRALISSLFIYRNFTRGNGQTWEAREFDGLAMISVTYKVKERTIKRLFPEGDSSDPMQGYQHSSITYEINAMGMPDIVQIDINLRRSLNGQFIQSNIHGSMRGVEDYEQLAQRLSTKAESIPAEYQRQKIGSHEPRKPFIIASAKVAHVEVAEIVSQLDRLISSENQPAKNGFFVALSD